MYHVHVHLTTVLCDAIQVADLCHYHVIKNKNGSDTSEDAIFTSHRATWWNWQQVAITLRSVAPPRMFASCKCNFLTILRYLYFLNEVEWECLRRIQLCRKECKIEKPLLNEECPRSLPHSERTNKWKQPLFTCYKVTLYDSPSQQRLQFANIFNGYLFRLSPIFNLTHFFWNKKIGNLVVIRF